MFNATTEAVIQKLFIHWNLSHFTIIFFVFGKTTAALFYAFCIIIHNHSLSSVSLNINVDIYFLYEILINLIQSFGDFRASEKKGKEREKKTLHKKKCGGMLLLMKLDEHRLNLYLFICWMKSEREAWKQVPVLVLLLLLYEAFYYDDIKNVIVLFIHPPPSMWALYVLLIHL